MGFRALGCECLSFLSIQNFMRLDLRHLQQQVCGNGVHGEEHWNLIKNVPLSGLLMRKTRQKRSFGALGPSCSLGVLWVQGKTTRFGV